MAKDGEGRPELEERVAVVDAWFKHLAENHVAGEIDREVLREVLESCGANFDIEPSAKEKLGREHYSSNALRKSVAAVWGDKYDRFVSWVKGYVNQMQDEGDEVPALESGKKHIGFTGLLEELTAYAATDEEEFSATDFATRVTARAWNGYMRYELGDKRKDVRMHIIVPGYNTVVYEFDGQEGDTRTGEMPFASLGFPPKFATAAWEEITSWGTKKP